MAADDITHALAAYATGCAADLADDVVESTKQRVLDSFACAIAGADEEAWRLSLEYALGRPSVETGATIWGSAHRGDPELAALVNGVAVRCLDLNDAYLGVENLHPSDFIPALLAVAECDPRSRHAGSDVILAIAIAYEVGLTLCDTLRLRDNGWDHVTITGIAACCGIGRLMDLTARQVENAISMFVVANPAMRQSRFGDLTMWKAIAGPNAVRDAVFYCYYARSGVEGPSEVFLGGNGLVNQVLGGAMPSLEPLDRLKALAAPSRVGESHLKLRGFAYAGHSSVDAASLIYEGLKGSGSEIADVEIATFQVAIDIMGDTDKWRPETRETADHSLPYMVYEMLRHGEVARASFRPERYASPAVHDFLSAHVTLVADETFTARFPQELPARVIVTTTDGRRFTETVDVPFGHARARLPWERLVEKVHDCADPVIGAHAASAVAQTVRDLEGVKHVRELCALLARDQRA